MPGNPLPKIEINASRWPYDENGPVNGKLGQVAVTPAPKALLNAENGKWPLVDDYRGEAFWLGHYNKWAANDLGEVPPENAQRNRPDAPEPTLEEKTGAYSVTDNVVNAFRKAVESGAKTITAERV